MQPERRKNHYTFAHLALRAYAEKFTQEFFTVLGGKEAQRFLKELWDDVTARFYDEKNAMATFDDFKVYPVRINGCPTAIIKLPEANATAEAHMVGAVLVPVYEEQFPDKTQVRYFTLEYGLNREGSRRTVLCEWRADGRHYNYGTGPTVQVDGFANALSVLLSREASECN